MLPAKTGAGNNRTTRGGGRLLGAWAACPKLGWVGWGWGFWVVMCGEGQGGVRWGAKVLGTKGATTRGR